MNTSPFFEEPSDQLVSLANLAKRDYPEDFTESAGVNPAEKNPPQSPETETFGTSTTDKASTQVQESAGAEAVSPSTPVTELNVVDERKSQPPTDIEVTGDTLTTTADRTEDVFRENVEKEAVTSIF